MRHPINEPESNNAILASNRVVWLPAIPNRWKCSWKKKWRVQFNSTVKCKSTNGLWINDGSIMQWKYKRGRRSTSSWDKFLCDRVELQPKMVNNLNQQCLAVLEISSVAVTSLDFVQNAFMWSTMSFWFSQLFAMFMAVLNSKRWNSSDSHWTASFQ